MRNLVLLESAWTEESEGFGGVGGDVGGCIELCDVAELEVDLGILVMSIEEWSSDCGKK